MITLYGSKGSGSAAAEAALELSGVAYETFDAAEWNKGPGYEALTRVNPLGQIPTLVQDDGCVMTESAAILIDLGLRHPNSWLLSTEPAQRAQQIRGLVFIAANCYAGIGIIDYPERWYPDPEKAVREQMNARSRARLHELWAMFADQFPATPWLSGERLGALDILASTVSTWSGARKALASSRPDFLALLQKVDATEPVKSVRARHWPDG